MQEKTIALPTEVRALKNLRTKVETKEGKIDRITRDVKGKAFLRLLWFIPFSNSEIFLNFVEIISQKHNDNSQRK